MLLSTLNAQHQLYSSAYLSFSPTTLGINSIRKTVSLVFTISTGSFAPLGASTSTTMRQLTTLSNAQKTDKYFLNNSILQNISTYSALQEQTNRMPTAAAIRYWLADNSVSCVTIVGFSRSIIVLHCRHKNHVISS